MVPYGRRVPPRNREPIGESVSPTVITINRNPGDFVKKTRHLSPEERGVYQDILDHIVLLGQDEDPPSLPDDERAISNLTGCSVSRWKSIRGRLCFGPLAVLIAENGRISQTRIVEEIEAAKKRIETAGRGGRASGAARRELRGRLLNGSSNHSSNGSSTPVHGRREGESNSERTSHESRVMSNKKKKEHADAPASDAHFDSLWAQYPLKDGRKAALKHYRASVKTESDRESITTALGNYLAHLSLNPWKQPKAGATWFNNWQDEEWQKPPAPSSPAKLSAVVYTEPRRARLTVDDLRDLQRWIDDVDEAGWDYESPYGCSRAEARDLITESKTRAERGEPLPEIPAWMKRGASEVSA